MLPIKKRSAAQKDTPEPAPEVMTIRQAIQVSAALQRIESLQPAPPLESGGYALAKWASKLEDELITYYKKLKQLHEDGSHKDKDGAAKFKVLDKKRSLVEYELIDHMETNRKAEKLKDHKITLTGVRKIYMSELGECPVGHGELKVLLGKVIIDEEPA